MTSLSTVGNEPQSLEGRSVRDIVEYSPELVNEVWCRKIFRQILQSLELQYAMQMPHRAITPDTIVFHENGEPLLAPAVVDDEDAKSEADDLTALAGIIHYAITRELLPSGPLHGRALEGYSDSLIAAVDRCMAPDPAERPQTIEQLRDILGIVALGPSTGARPAAARPDALVSAADPAAAPTATAAATRATATTATMTGTATAPTTSAPAAAQAVPAWASSEKARTPATRRPGLGRWQRWSIAGGGAAVLVALALVMFAEMRDSGTYDHIVLTQPQADGARDAQAGVPARAQEPAAGPAAPPASANVAAPAAAAAPGASVAAPAAAPDLNAASDNAAQAGAPAAPATDAAPADPALAQAHPATPVRGASGAGASYRLRIQPWGAISVDGVDRGISPPLKRLTLAPGKHTLRVSNPAFEDRVLDIDTTRGGGQVMVDFNDAR